MKTATVPRFHEPRFLIFAAFVVFAIEAIYLGLHWGLLRDQGLLGPDSYMRLLRILDLFQGSDWYNPHFERTNAPYGETLHWTRSLDAVLYAVAWVMSLFIDDRTAVYFAGLTIGPLLAVLMIPIWSWGTRPFLRGPTFLLIFVASGIMGHYFINLEAGRSDHHGFLALLFVAQLVLVFRLRTGADARLAALLLGVAGGLSVWTSVEALLAQFMFAVVLVVFYVRQPEQSARHILLYTVGLAVMLSVALPLERPLSDLFLVAFKRFSIVHWTLAVTTAATWAAIFGYFRFRSMAPMTRAKLISVLLGAAVPLAVMAVLFPKFFLGPSVDFGPGLYTQFETISEFQPLFPNSRNNLARFLTQLGPVLIALGYVVYGLRNGPTERRSIHFILLVGIMVYIPFAMWQQRFVIYAQILALVPWALALVHIMAWPRTIGIFGQRLHLRVFIVMAAVCGPFTLAGALGEPTAKLLKTYNQCAWPEVENFLSGMSLEDSKNKILLSYRFKGPELVWRTPFKVVGAPYGNSASRRDTDLIFKSETYIQAKSLIDARGIDLILICEKERNNQLDRQQKHRSFMSRIANGAHPDWISPILLPANLSTQFKLFRVLG